MTPTNEDLELYVIGEYDGDVAALEAALDDAALARLADEARLEVLLREAGAAATFCPGCGDLAPDARCEACGVALRPGGYVVERVLVSNAHGRMYVARDADGAQVALKELAFVQAPSLAVVAAFEREARFLRALEHPAIPRFVASFEEGSGVHVRYYLAQELVEGTPLDVRLEDHWFTEAEIVDVARRVLDVLVYLQSLSPMVIHRDIKPANLIARGDQIFVVDFGAAHVQGTTAGSTSIGTFGYMPIEQLAGQVDATTDAYALGATLLHLLSRQEPWRIVQVKNLDAINVSPGLRALLAKLVAPDPRDRFANAAAARAALDALGAPPVATAPTARRRSWWRPVALAAAAFALVAGGAGGYALLTPRPEKPLAPAETATLRFVLSIDGPAQLVVDGRSVATVRDKDALPIEAGLHEVVLVGPNDQRCRQLLMLAGGQTTTFECQLQPTGVNLDEQHLPPGKNVSVDVRDAPLHQVLRMVATQCDIGLVLPDSIEAKVTINLHDVPCDQALEVLLQSRELWFVYDRDVRVARVAPRIELEREARAQAERDRRGIRDDELPRGAPIDVDFAYAPIHDLAALMARAGDVNIVVPDTVEGKVTMRMKGVPWDRALRMMLASHGLWYRFRPNGKILRVAPRIDIDREYRRP